MNNGPTHRRHFLKTGLGTGLAVSGLTSWLQAQPQLKKKKRFKTAFGLNGFQSSSNRYKKNYPIWEILDFAQKEGFEGVELTQNWPQGALPFSKEDKRIRSLREFYAKYNQKIFSIQTFTNGDAYSKNRSERERWLKQFRDQVYFAKKAGAECIGFWPTGNLRGQSVQQGIENLILSLKEAAKIVADQELLFSLEVEPPFNFNKIEHLIAIIEGVSHPLIKAMYDPSHFDLMNGGKGKPEELLLKIGIDKIGYLHLTDCDGTIYEGTSKHLACGEGHIDIAKSLDLLWDGGFEGWVMIDAWMIQDPYNACSKGKKAIDQAQARKLKSS